MQTKSRIKYYQNCFLLVVPILIWNFLLSDKLPSVFQPQHFNQGVPPIILYGENITRTLLFGLTLIMPFDIRTAYKKRAFVLYIIGVMLYFMAWMLLIYLPNSTYSQSVLGFAAPAFTPLVWLVAIGLLARSFYFKLQFKQWYFIVLSLIFITLHLMHTLTIYYQIH